jgi:hypothetical protein
MKGEATRLAALQSVAKPFDWDAHNAAMDAALARWNETERELAEAHMSMARDLRALIGEIGK